MSTSPLILSPSTSTAAGASLAQAAQVAVQLSPGDVMDALVLSLIKDMTFRLQLPAGTLDVQTDKPLIPGTRVELAVKGTVAEPEIFLTPLPDAAKSLRTATLTQTTAQNAAQPQAALPPPERLAQVAATIVRDAATRQGGIAQLYADLEASFAQPKVSIPPAVVGAARQLFALRLDATTPDGVDADDIKTALIRSGLVTNATAADDPARPSVPLDARAVLLSLRAALKNWETAERVTPQPAATPAPTVAQAAPPPTRPAGPMLPYPNGPAVPQPLADPSIPQNATARELALLLLDTTDSAIAREMILKIASLPDRVEFNGRPADANPSRMTFDIPMATPHGTAVAQLRIERDAAQRNGEVIEPVWRANFSVDVEPIGAVHVRIALIGGKATVTLNAERKESAESLSAGLPLLEAGLRGAEIEPGVLICQAGQPVTASAEHGLYVDHAT
jgi:hypothetical protein